MDVKTYLFDPLNWQTQYSLQEQNQLSLVKRSSLFVVSRLEVAPLVVFCIAQVVYRIFHVQLQLLQAFLHTVLLAGSTITFQGKILKKSKVVYEDLSLAIKDVGLTIGFIASTPFVIPLSIVIPSSCPHLFDVFGLYRSEILQQLHGFIFLEKKIKDIDDTVSEVSVKDIEKLLVELDGKKKEIKQLEKLGILPKKSYENLSLHLHSEKTHLQVIKKTFTKPVPPRGYRRPIRIKPTVLPAETASLPSVPSILVEATPVRIAPVSTSLQVHEDKVDELQNSEEVSFLQVAKETFTKPAPPRGYRRPIRIKPTVLPAETASLPSVPSILVAATPVSIAPVSMPLQVHEDKVEEPPPVLQPILLEDVVTAEVASATFADSTEMQSSQLSTSDPTTSIFSEEKIQRIKRIRSAPRLSTVSQEDMNLSVKKLMMQFRDSIRYLHSLNRTREQDLETLQLLRELQLAVCKISLREKMREDVLNSRSKKDLEYMLHIFDLCSTSSTPLELLVSKVPYERVRLKTKDVTTQVGELYAKLQKDLVDGEYKGGLDSYSEIQLLANYIDLKISTGEYTISASEIGTLQLLLLYFNGSKDPANEIANTLIPTLQMLSQKPSLEPDDEHTIHRLGVKIASIRMGFDNGYYVANDKKPFDDAVVLHNQLVDVCEKRFGPSSEAAEEAYLKDPTNFEKYLHAFCPVQYYFPEIREFASEQARSGEILLRNILSGEAHTYPATHEEAQNQMISLTWFMMKEAIRKGQGYHEGTFVIPDPNGKLKTYLEKLPYHQTGDLTSGLGGIARWAVSSYTREDITAGEELAKIGSGFASYFMGGAGAAPRPSSHYVGRLGECQGGFDIYSSTYKLPAFKTHLLFGDIDVTTEEGITRQRAVFLKPENAGVNDILSLAHHTVEYAQALGRRWSGTGNDEPGMRKERVPEVEMGLFKKFVKSTETDVSIQNEMIAKAKLFGLSYMYDILSASSASMTSDTDGGKLMQMLSTYDHMENRTGREVWIDFAETTTQSLMDSIYISNA